MFNHKVDIKLAQSIEEDIEQIDGDTRPKAKSAPPSKPVTQACDCVGGPGKNNSPGTGLLDDYTICPACNGSGRVTRLA